MVNDSWAYIDRIKRNGEEQRHRKNERLRLEIIKVLNTRYSPYFDTEEPAEDSNE